MADEPLRFIAARELDHSLKTLREANSKCECEKTELKNKLDAIEKMGKDAKEAKEKASPWNVVIIVIIVIIFLALVSRQ